MSILQTVALTRYSYTSDTKDYWVTTLGLQLDYTVHNSSTLPVYGFLASLEGFLVAGDAAVSHLHCTGQHVGRGAAEIYRGLHHS